MCINKTCKVLTEEHYVQDFDMHISFQICEAKLLASKLE